MIYDLLQQHTVEVYNLKSYAYKVYKVNARSLLLPQRFDLFAKLYYIRNMESNPEVAKVLYKKHIIAFNPDGKEPGRDDKSGVDDFLLAFNKIINHFRVNDFDDSISMVPVDEQGVILDGSHRVAALAFFNKNVTIAKFNDVRAKCDFDYNYFMYRGLASCVCDTIALEMIQWCDDILVACFWPRMGGDREKESALEEISSKHQVAYVKKMVVSINSLTQFVKEVYKDQSWTQSIEAVKDKTIRVYSSSRRCMWLVFFQNGLRLETVIEEKEQLRARFGLGKDSLHVTDSIGESRQIAFLSLNEKGLLTWQTDFHLKYNQVIIDKWLYFKRNTWINFKCKVWSLLHML